jgi:hypothetical protein
MIQMVGIGCDCDFLNPAYRPAENQPMLIPALLTVLLGAILNGGTAVMEDEDVVRHIGLGAVGGAVAVGLLIGIFWVLGLFIEFDTSAISF